VCSGQLLTTANGTLPLIVAGAPTVTVGLTSLGRVLFAIGVTLLLSGGTALLLMARTNRQLGRRFEDVGP
jgi:hypothetical protein